MPDLPDWPAWATANVDTLSRADARTALRAAQGFWRDFACAGLTLPELREVIEARRRKAQGQRHVPSPKPAVRGRVPMAGRPDHTLFDSFPPLDPEDERWTHA